MAEFNLVKSLFKKKSDLADLSNSFLESDIENLIILIQIGSCIICNTTYVSQSKDCDLTPHVKSLCETIGRFNNYMECHPNKTENFDSVDVATDFIIKYTNED
jgi:hypothetical protein